MRWEFPVVSALEKFHMILNIQPGPSVGYTQPMPVNVTNPVPPFKAPPPTPWANTREGVRFFSNVLLLEIIIGVLDLVLIIAMINLVVAAIGTGNFLKAVGLVFLEIAPVEILLDMLQVIALVYFVLGLLRFYKGRFEFGPQRARNFNLAIIFLIMSFLVPIIGGVVEQSQGTNLMYIFNPVRVYPIFLGPANFIGVLFIVLFLICIVRPLGSSEMPGFRLGMILIILGLYLFYRGYKNLQAKIDSGQIRPKPEPLPSGLPSGE